MIEQATAPVSVPLGGLRRFSAYVELAKPRVVVMVLVTTIVGFYLATPGPTAWILLLHTLASTALAAGGTMALNQYMERDLDALMLRTRMRPIPAGRLQPRPALVFGAVVATIGMVYQAVAVGPLATVITAATSVSYLFFYTPMKRWTPFCSLVGAVPGALPPVTGWAAATGHLGPEAAALFAILFLWQFPHQLAIARLYRDDYARAGIRLLPVIDPDGPATGRQTVIHSAALLAVALVPTLLHVTGLLYFVCALVLGVVLLTYSIRLARSRSLADARRLLFASLVYLPVLLGVMAIDKLR